jgi:hypothetical protein
MPAFTGLQTRLSSDIAHYYGNEVTPYTSYPGEPPKYLPQATAKLFHDSGTIPRQRNYSMTAE